MLPSKFKDQSKTNMKLESSSKKVMIEVDQNVNSPKNIAKKAVVRQKQFLMDRAQMLDKMEKEGHPLSPLSEKHEGQDGTQMYEQATTLLNGSEANRDISQVGGPDTPCLNSA